MIKRGRHNDVLLFEITDQDLLETGAFSSSYNSGNILLFTNQQSICIGQELARADDLACALEFLGDGQLFVEAGFGSENLPATPPTAPPATPPTTAENNPLLDSSLIASINSLSFQPTTCQTAVSCLPPENSVSEPASPPPAALVDQQINELNHRIEQRDGLLHDLSEQLQQQKEENELLNLMLEHTQSQLMQDAASRDELMDDLQQASSNTYVIENNLERIMEEKFLLEQELAEKITQLMESSMANDDLRRRLDNQPDSNTNETAAVANDANEVAADEKAVGGSAAVAVANNQQDSAAATFLTDNLQVAQPPEANQVLTMSGGKQIHIYHEFPVAKRQPLAQIRSFSRGLLQTATILLLFAILTLAGSVLATSWTNSISYGQALDLIFRNVFHVFSG
jgi:regulator of replication initiation timing